MARPSKSVSDAALLRAALEGLELQRQRVDDQIRQVKKRLGVRAGAQADSLGLSTAKAGRKRRKLSAGARKRIADAQKRRWAEYRKKGKGKAAAAAA